MEPIAEFEEQLKRNSNPHLALWREVDLHNHTPASDCYEDRSDQAWDAIADRIRQTGLSMVMFADHGQLPDLSRLSWLAKETDRLVLPGVELNVFVDAFQRPSDKVTKGLFFHLLLGFDPDGPQPPDYWINHVHREYPPEERQSEGNTLHGINASIKEVHDVLSGSNAIIIPAHLHSTNDAFKSRSVDDIYDDPEFLRVTTDFFTALEVTSPRTAEFFDGKHEETNLLRKTCIRSSDSHRPDRIGWRTSHVLVEDLTFAQLKAALELPWRSSLAPPPNLIHTLSECTSRDSSFGSSG